MVLVQNWLFLQLFFLGNVGHLNVFYDIPERKKKHFVAYKNRKFKKSKNRPFSKGVSPWICFENWPYFGLFFRQYRAGKCVLGYSRKKKNTL